MVSAVFHGPFEAPTLTAPSSSSPQPHNALKSIADKDHSTLGSMEKILKNDELKATTAPGNHWSGKSRDFWTAVLPPVMGLVLLPVLVVVSVPLLRGLGPGWAGAGAAFGDACGAATSAPSDTRAPGVSRAKPTVTTRSPASTPLISAARVSSCVATTTGRAATRSSPSSA